MPSTLFKESSIKYPDVTVDASKLEGGKQKVECKIEPVGSTCKFTLTNSAYGTGYFSNTISFISGM
ncbi:MAG: hypothetical protein JW735_01565, partial [Prolixibacteraceae bacterium]|nr:hypothetical protein [Prolixibacteraceae bacterium]